jgi:hypothetical protein
VKKKYPDIVEKGRVRGNLNIYATAPGDSCGAFHLRAPTGGRLRLLVSDGSDWAACGFDGVPFEHVSVSLEDRCPTWEEMCWVKALFWEPEEVVIQYHPKESQYVNHHKFCLHLWRPVGVELPCPPRGCLA